MISKSKPSNNRELTGASQRVRIPLASNQKKRFVPVEAEKTDTDTQASFGAAVAPYLFWRMVEQIVRECDHWPEMPDSGPMS